MTSSTSTQFLRFSLVGAVGFALDSGILYLLVSSGFDPFMSRIPSFLIATATTWFLNRSWTFPAAKSHTKVGRQSFNYLVVQTAGAAVNYLCYVSMLKVFGHSPIDAIKALVVAAGLALAVNFLGARHIAFKSSPPRQGR